MLHLSLLRLPITDRRWRNLSLYQAHQITWKAFPGINQRPFLFHLNEHADHYGLLVQSTVAPDWSCVPNAEIGLKVFDPHAVEAGARFYFSLRANPTVMREGYSDGKRRRVAVSANIALRKQRARERGLDLAEEAFDPETTLLRWLARKGERAGFELLGSLVNEQERRCHAGPTITYRVRREATEQRSAKRPMTIHGCDFTGALSVTDPDAFAKARRQGIGRAKSFGFGLLMLTPF